MSLLSALMASVSGMNAQANSLATISDNIANANTTGYKDAQTQFEDMLSSVTPSNYNAGGVATVVRYNIAAQGSLAATTSNTDLAVQGNGFFVVQNGSGANLLTRAGSFTQNSAGNLVNAAGFTLMGEPIAPGATSSANISGLDQLVPVVINPVSLVANPTTTGTFVANLDSNAAISAAPLPSANVATSAATDETSITGFDNLGNAVNMNVYFTNLGGDQWEVDVYNAADAAAGGGFPYSTAALTTQTLNFNPANGSLTSPTSLSIPIPNGQTMNLDISQMTQLASPFSITNNTTNGNAPATFQDVSVSQEGVLSEVYSNGTTVPVYTIPLATVASVDSLTPVAGDAYQANDQSGSVVVGAANTGGFGAIEGDQLESSTVDLATQLTDMVVAQNSYTANSKAFQVGSDLLQELANLIK